MLHTILGDACPSDLRVAVWRTEPRGVCSGDPASVYRVSLLEHHWKD